MHVMLAFLKRPNACAEAGVLSISIVFCICVLILVLCRICVLILVFCLAYVCMLMLVLGVLMQLNRLAAKYTSDSYDVLNCNCNHFTEDLCMAICGVQVFPFFSNPFFFVFL